MTTNKYYIHIYTGEGKGKSTAAAGLAVRAKSRGLSVLFLQVMKSGSSGGELELLKDIAVDVGRYQGIKSPYFNPDVNLAEMHSPAVEMMEYTLDSAGGYDLVIIDEFNNLVSAGILSEEEAVRFMKDLSGKAEVVLTGRGATERMTDAADYVTVMEEVKHPFREGVKARKGIEY